MGIFWINCIECKKLFQWWSGNLDQRCEECKIRNQTSTAASNQKERITS